MNTHGSSFPSKTCLNPFCWGRCGGRYRWARSPASSPTSKYVGNGMKWRSLWKFEREWYVLIWFLLLSLAPYLPFHFQEKVPGFCIYFKDFTFGSLTQSGSCARVPERRDRHKPLASLPQRRWHLPRTVQAPPCRSCPSPCLHCQR